MKICVYGISCSGKDTLVSELLKSPNMKNYRHCKGSFLLNKCSKKIFHKDFNLLIILKKILSESNLQNHCKKKITFL